LSTHANIRTGKVPVLIFDFKFDFKIFLEKLRTSVSDPDPHSIAAWIRIRIRKTEDKSVSDPDPHSIAAWIWIRIRSGDPDPGGLKKELK
jgi:hypothetical protein